MPALKTGKYPEPVPYASQLAALPFLSAVEGWLRGAQPKVEIRLTLHRALNREGQQYLQQITNYLGSESEPQKPDVGRMFEVTYGIIGAAFERGVILRTRSYESKDRLLVDLKRDMEDTGDTADISTRRHSWLAIPFLGVGRRPVLVLFADTFEFNFFADNDRTRGVANMCWGFSRLIDGLERNPFPTLRNYPFAPGDEVRGTRTVYPRLQEEVPEIPAPKFQNISSFNYESSAG